MQKDHIVNELRIWIETKYQPKDEYPLLLIQNIVATFTARVERINLDVCCIYVPHSTYNRKVFRALISRQTNPKTTILTFSSGKNVCTGAKTLLEARIGCRQLVSTLQAVGFEVTMGDFSIENIVGSCRVGWHIDLERLAQDYTSMANYDPRLFPGLIFRIENPDIVFLVFRAGNLVVTGNRAAESMEAALAWFYVHILQSYKDERHTIDYSAGRLDDEFREMDPSQEEHYITEDTVSLLLKNATLGSIDTISGDLPDDPERTPLLKKIQDLLGTKTANINHEDTFRLH